MNGILKKDEDRAAPLGTSLPLNGSSRSRNGANLAHTYSARVEEELLARAREHNSLQRSEERYRDFFENAKDAIYVHDLKGRFTLVNHAAERLMGHFKHEILDMNIFEVVPQNYVEKIRSILTQKLTDHAPTVYEVEVIRRDGKRIPVEVNSRLIYEHGVPVGVQGTARDISERWRHEEAIRESEERFRAVTETASDAILVIDENSIIRLANPATGKIFGYAIDELQGRSISLLMPERLREKHALALQGYLHSNHKQMAWEAVELPGLHRSGREIPLELSFAEFTRGGRRFFTGIARDVTERKRAQEALRESEERFRSIFENAKDVVFTCDLEGNFTSINQAGEELTEYSYEEAMATNFAKVVAPEHQQIVRDMIGDKAAGDLATSYELEIITRSGRRVLVEISSRTLFRDGMPIGVQGSARDITERRRSEQALRLSEAKFSGILSIAADAIISVDEAQNITLFNEGAEKIFGYRKDEVFGKPLEMLIPADQHALRDENVPPFDDSHLVFRHLGERQEIFALRESGEEFPAEASISKLELNGEKIYTVVLRDISERKHAEEALCASQVQLQQSQKLEAIGQLAGGVAHDFNNLLTAITGYSDLTLRRLQGDDPIRRNLEEIKKAADRAASLTRQLLAFSRKQILEPKVLNLNSVVTDMHKMLRRLIGEDIELATNLRADLGKVKADPGQVEQILMNLVVNARDAMPRGGKVTIETANVALDDTYAFQHVPVQPGEYVMLAITDTGSGMDQETQSHIFEPFFTTKESGKGTGLGLSTVYGIVKQSGGYIWVYSEIGSGTCFKVYLPLAFGSEPARPKQQPHVAAVGGTETILLVEDEEIVRRMARLILESAGYKVLEAVGAQDALRLCYQNAERIDLMLTDVIMPDMSGRVLAEQVALVCPDLPVLYMSGYTDDAIVRHGLLGDLLEFIQKPFTADSLARKVRNVLDTHGIGVDRRA